MPIPSKPRESHLKRLQRELPEGLLVDAAWLEGRGYSRALRRKYVMSGWLAKPASQVYRRPDRELKWQHVVVSLQALLQVRVVVGGRTSLALRGYEHYVSPQVREVQLCGTHQPPSWINDLGVDVEFLFRNSRGLFGADLDGIDLPDLRMPRNERPRRLADLGLEIVRWGERDWPLVTSGPERAILEVMDAVPQRETFHQADMIMEGLRNLRPSRVQHLLERCKRVKAKRLFLYLATRHHHAWLQHVNRNDVDLGSGPRSLAPGGHFDAEFQITVPDELAEEAV